MRQVNAIVAAFITAFFVAHAFLGAFSVRFGLSDALAFLVWIGIAALAVHVVLSIVTTQQMMTDTVRPPSDRKKRHQVLKWITGIAVALIAIVHGSGVLNTQAGEPTQVGIFLSALLAIAIAVHVCVGTKSLTRDLGMDKKWRMPFRVIVSVLCGIAAAVLLFAS